MLGEFIGARSAYHAEVEARLKLLENERDQQATIAVAAERTRIARELHDVVAHAVSVIVVQADGAGYAIRDNPDLAESAVRTIAETGREALNELRRLLEVLRNDTDEHDTRSPQPDVSGLPELAERSPPPACRCADRPRRPRRPARHRRPGHLPDRAGGADQHAQVRGHRRVGDVRVERVGGLIEVEVDDDGGPVARLPAPGPARRNWRRCPAATA